MALAKIQQLRRGVLAAQEQRWYEIIFAVLAVVSGLLLFVELVISGIPEGTILRIHTVDLAIAYLFLTDFFIGIACTFSRRLYLRENWLNFVSSVPVSTEVFRALRLLRFIRAVRVIRVAANAKEIFEQGRRLKDNEIKNGQ
ncbi:MAG: hypothetical protein HYT49_03490 [Candidatus Wildermuthbacteria bacterium]|nr:hypothetical protein [Candidatus Wildermuthbacteria bacterium]